MKTKTGVIAFLVLAHDLSQLHRLPSPKKNGGPSP